MANAMKSFIIACLCLASLAESRQLKNDIQLTTDNTFSNAEGSNIDQEVVLNVQCPKETPKPTKPENGWKKNQAWKPKKVWNPALPQDPIDAVCAFGDTDYTRMEYTAAPIGETERAKITISVHPDYKIKPVIVSDIMHRRHDGKITVRGPGIWVRDEDVNRDTMPRRVFCGWWNNDANGRYTYEFDIDDATARLYYYVTLTDRAIKQRKEAAAEEEEDKPEPLPQINVEINQSHTVVGSDNTIDINSYVDVINVDGVLKIKIDNAIANGDDNKLSQLADILRIDDP